MNGSALTARVKSSSLGTKMNRFLEMFSWPNLNQMPDTALYRDGLVYLALILFVAPLLLSVYLKLKAKGRPSAYRGFDRIWFWGLLILGFAGLFEWFSVSQKLPFFGTKLAILIWAVLVLGFGAFLAIYFRTQTVKELVRHHEKKRKERYLR